MADAAQFYRSPVDADDKYSRGVVGLATGSTEYPGAAMLSADGALATGIGMVRYRGPASVAAGVVARRPEVVIADGRVDAWVVGSGMSGVDLESLDRARSTLRETVPLVVDAGALALLPTSGSIVATPHAGELAKLLGVPRDEVVGAPAEHALIAASTLNVTIVLKGSTTCIATPDHEELFVDLATPWLATAGTGDVLAGVIGAIVASRRREIETQPSLLARAAATGVVIHSLAARRASSGGPFLASALANEIPGVIRGMLAR